MTFPALSTLLPKLSRNLKVGFQSPNEMLIFTWVWLIGLITGAVVDLTKKNEEILEQTELFLVNFYADWCRFSRQLHPIFVNTETALREAYPDESVVRMGRVDCDDQAELAQKYRISKYPTIKVFRYGIEMKKEYRGTRSPEEFRQ